MREIDNLKNLSHPNIVKYYGSNISKDGTTLSISMELMHTSIESYLRTKGPMRNTQIRDYIPQFLNGLLYIHDQGIIHKDLKGNLTFYKIDGVKMSSYLFQSLRCKSSSRFNKNSLENSRFWVCLFPKD